MVEGSAAELRRPVRFGRMSSRSRDDCGVAAGAFAQAAGRCSRPAGLMRPGGDRNQHGARPTSRRDGGYDVNSAADPSTIGLNGSGSDGLFDAAARGPRLFVQAHGPRHARTAAPCSATSAPTATSSPRLPKHRSHGWRRSLRSLGEDGAADQRTGAVLRLTADALVLPFRRRARRTHPWHRATSASATSIRSPTARR